MLQEILNFLRDNWSALIAAPAAFITLAILMLSVGYSIARLHYSGRVETLQTQINSLRELTPSALLDHYRGMKEMYQDKINILNEKTEKAYLDSKIQITQAKEERKLLEEQLEQANRRINDLERLDAELRELRIIYEFPRVWARIEEALERPPSLREMATAFNMTEEELKQDIANAFDMNREEFDQELANNPSFWSPS